MPVSVVESNKSTTNPKPIFPYSVKDIEEEYYRLGGVESETEENRDYGFAVYNVHWGPRVFPEDFKSKSPIFELLHEYRTKYPCSSTGERFDYLPYEISKRDDMYYDYGLGKYNNTHATFKTKEDGGLYMVFMEKAEGDTPSLIYKDLVLAYEKLCKDPSVETTKNFLETVPIKYGKYDFYKPWKYGENRLRVINMLLGLLKDGVLYNVENETFF